MSQEQPQRPADWGQEQPRRATGWSQEQPIRYGDVFDVSGELASRPVAPRDAAMMQSSKTEVLGQTQKGGPAAVMQSAATRNEQTGRVGHRDITDVAADRGATVAETDVPGARLITESIGGQVIGQFVEATPLSQTIAVGAVEQRAIKIGEALEATAQTAGDKPLDQSDAAAIQAAEIRAIGTTILTPGGLVVCAQAAANYNSAMARDEDKVRLRDVLARATAKLPADKAVTRQDAEGVASAERRHNPNQEIHPGGVASSMAAAQH